MKLQIFTETEDSAKELFFQLKSYIEQSKFYEIGINLISTRIGIYIEPYSSIRVLLDPVTLKEPLKESYSLVWSFNTDERTRNYTNYIDNMFKSTKDYIDGFIELEDDGTEDDEPIEILPILTVKNGSRTTFKIEFQNDNLVPMNSYFLRKIEPNC